MQTTRRDVLSFASVGAAGDMTLALNACAGTAASSRAAAAPASKGGKEELRGTAQRTPQRPSEPSFQVGQDLGPDAIPEKARVRIPGIFAPGLAQAGKVVPQGGSLDAQQGANQEAEQMFAIAVDRDVLTRLTLDLVRRTFVICDAVLSQAGLRAAALDGVFLAGGTTLLPIVRKAVSQYFSRTPRMSLDPMEVVGIGTCVARARMG